MTRIKFSKYGTSPFQKLIGHNEKILNSWISLKYSVLMVSTLDRELLEQIRRTLSFGNNCEYCMVKDGEPNNIKKNKREQIAIAFAELFSLDHKSINNEHFLILKEELSDKEISELCSFISFTTASQKIGSIFNLTGDYQNSAIGSRF